MAHKPQVIPAPHFYQLFPGFPIYIDDPSFTVNSVGRTRIHVMVIEQFMGILIGYNGNTIKTLAKRYHVHTQSWKKYHIFEEKHNNITAIWTLEHPSFIIFGDPKNVYDLLSYFCHIISNMKRIRPIRQRQRKEDADTLTLYKEQLELHKKYLDKINHSLPKKMLTHRLIQRCNEYDCPRTDVVVSFIMNHYDIDNISRFLRDRNHFISFLVVVEFIFENDMSLTKNNIDMLTDIEDKFEKEQQQYRKNVEHPITYEELLSLVSAKDMYGKHNTSEHSYQYTDLTDEEERDGELFTFETHLRDCFT